MECEKYCIIALGKTDGIVLEINNISEEVLGSIHGGGIFIATFISFVNIGEMTSWFKLCNRNFFLFKLNDDSSGYNIIKTLVSEELFGKLGDLDKQIINKNILLDSEINSVINENIEYHSLSFEEKEKLMNDIIDKGVDNISDSDKKILKELSNNNE